MYLFIHRPGRMNSHRMVAPRVSESSFRNVKRSSRTSTSKSTVTCQTTGTSVSTVKVCHLIVPHSQAPHWAITLFDASYVLLVALEHAGPEETEVRAKGDAQRTGIRQRTRPCA